MKKVNSSRYPSICTCIQHVYLWTHTLDNLWMKFNNHVYLPFPWMYVFICWITQTSAYLKQSLSWISLCWLVLIKMASACHITITTLAANQYCNDYNLFLGLDLRYWHFNITSSIKIYKRKKKHFNINRFITSIERLFASTIHPKLLTF